MWLNTVAQFDDHYVLTLFNPHANATLSFPLDLRLNLLDLMKPQPSDLSRLRSRSLILNLLTIIVVTDIQGLKNSV